MRIGKFYNQLRSPLMIRKSLLISKYLLSVNFNSNKDYYKILNIKQTANQQQIKKAFRNLAKLYHPDANKGNQQKFKQINEAYQVLSQQSTKRDYDQVRRAQSTSSSSTSYNSGASTRSNYRQDYNRTREQYNTYRGYQQDSGWNNRQFRQQVIKQMYRKQQQSAARQNFNSKNDQTLRNRSRSSQDGQNYKNLQDELDEMFRRNMQQIKVTRQTVRRAYQQQQKRRQKQFKQFRDKQREDFVQNAKDRAWKMAEGVKDNVQGIIKVGKYVKENADGIIKAGKFVKGLWDQFKKNKK